MIYFFIWSARTIRQGLNFTLTSSAGPIDIFGEIEGGGTYDELLPHTVDVTAFGVRCHCLDLPALIRAKRAAGRTKDLNVVAELETLIEDDFELPIDQPEDEIED